MSRLSMFQTDGPVVESRKLGGHIYCRIWRTWTVGEQANDIEFEVVYNITQDGTVALQSYEWDAELEAYTFCELLETATAETPDDQTLAELAQDLMNDHQTEKA